MNTKNNNEGATLSLKGHGYYSEATRDNVKEADCAVRHWSGTTVCGVLCCLVWLSLAPGEGSVTDCYAQHVTHTYNSTYAARNKQTTDGLERIKCDSNSKTSKACKFTTSRERSYCSTGFNPLALELDI